MTLVDPAKAYVDHRARPHIFGTWYRDSAYHWCDCGTRGPALTAEDLVEHTDAFGLDEPLAPGGASTDIEEVA